MELRNFSRTCFSLTTFPNIRANYTKFNEIFEKKINRKKCGTKWTLANFISFIILHIYVNFIACKKINCNKKTHQLRNILRTGT